MKKWFCLFFAAALLFASCDSLPFITEDSGTTETNPENDDPVDDDPADDPGSEDPPPFTSPMGTPGDLAPSGAEYDPADETEALDIVNMAVISLLDLNSEPPPPVAAVRAVVGETLWMNWNETLGDGSVDFSGNISRVLTEPDEMLPLEPEDYLINIASFYLEADFSGEVYNITVDDGEYEYLIDGSLESSADMELNCDVLCVPDGDGFGEEYDYDVEMDYEFGLAFSVLRDDGKGARFILSHSCSFEVQDVPEIVFDNDFFFFLSEVPYAVLYVFNDDEELIGEYEVTPDELGLFTILDLDPGNLGGMMED